jgi:hypothetical protein
MYNKGKHFIHFGAKWIAIMSVLLIAQMLHAQTRVFVAARDTEIKGIEGALSANNASFIPIIYQYSLDPDNKV